LCGDSSAKGTDRTSGEASHAMSANGTKRKSAVSVRVYRETMTRNGKRETNVR
jgi:hypothetical protein